jgi:DNA-binding transcriptional LysR family regulator
VLALVAAGLGSAIVPESVGDLRPRGVALRPLRGVDVEIELVAVSSDDRSALVANFLSLIPRRPNPRR